MGFIPDDDDICEICNSEVEDNQEIWNNCWSCESVTCSKCRINCDGCGAEVCPECHLESCCTLCNE